MIATAAFATTAGFLVLLLSPIPMIRGFGLLLVVGVVVSLAVALTAGLAVLSLTPRDRGRSPLAARRSRSAREPGRLAKIGEARRPSRVGSVRSGAGRSRSRSPSPAGCSRSGS